MLKQKHKWLLVFLDQLIGLYNRINTSQKDRMYIIHELKKYYNPKVIKFFFKLNDTELNKQLRKLHFIIYRALITNPDLDDKNICRFIQREKNVKNI